MSSHHSAPSPGTFELMAGAWTDEENRETVRSYFAMLEQELTNQPYVKADYRRLLAQRLGRSPGAIEYKYQNVSAVLLSMRAPFIDGYKPAWNYQASLERTVGEFLRHEPRIGSQMESSVSAPAAPRIDLMWRQDVFPTLALSEVWKHNARPVPVPRDFVQLEAANRALGIAGELAIVEFEQKRLTAAGQTRLAARIDHVSRTAGDGLGYDISSFEADGKPRLIEVKTTRRGVDWPMFLSRHEVDVSEELADVYFLYRVFEFSKPKPGLYQLKGAIRESCDLDPQSYAGLPAAG